jgi:hypothetical protein
MNDHLEREQTTAITLGVDLGFIQGVSEGKIEASNVVISEGQNIVRELTEQGKTSEAEAVLHATIRIATAILT